MRISRYRSSNIIVIAIITIVIGLVESVVVGCLSGVEIKSDFYFNWSNAITAFAPLLAAGMILLGLAQLTSLGEEIEAKNNEEQEFSIRENRRSV